MPISWSAIIPSFNRAKSLERTLQSLVTQTCASEEYEIIVVDNGSTDDTKVIVNNFIAAYPKHNIKYFYDPIPGLLTGRHRGLAEASADVLTFFDDDVTVNENFATQVIKVFADKNAVIAGGPSFPEYEVEPPKWIEHYWHVSNDGIRYCPALSLMDAGENARYIDPIYVWGLNFSIRKSTLIEVGGFAPDCYPNDLFIFVGDGECAITKKLMQQGIQAYYDPTLSVIHHTPSDRLTENYFKRRMAYDGVGESYVHIRSDEIGRHLHIPREPKEGLSGIHDRIFNARAAGYLLHHIATLKNPQLMDWVLRHSYLDNSRPPELPMDAPTNIDYILDGKIALSDIPVLIDILSESITYKKTQNALWKRGVRFLRRVCHTVGLGKDFEKIVGYVKRI